MLAPAAQILEIWRASQFPPRELVSLRSFDGVSAVARCLPAAMFGWGFECRLSAGDERVDFGTMVTAASGGPALLAVFGRSSPALRADPRWGRVADFCEEWSAPGSRLARYVPFAFLEFDVGARASTSAPSLFFRLPTPWELVSSSEGPFDPFLAKEIALLGLRRLAGGNLRQETVRRIDNAFSVLPAGGRMLHAALLVGRDGEVRLYASLPRSKAADYLTAVGYGAVIDAVIELASRYEPDKPIIEVQFEMIPAAVPRLGLELPCQDRDPERRRSLFASVLDELVSHGLCAAQKRTALVEWPGLDRIDLGGRPCEILREISHLKLVVETGRPPRAKAYMAVTPRLLS